MARAPAFSCSRQFKKENKNNRLENEKIISLKTFPFSKALKILLKLCSQKEGKSVSKIITNKKTLLDLQSDWEGVIKMQERMQKLVLGTWAAPASITGPGVAKVVYNLPVLLAFDVLKSAVIAAQNERISVWPNTKELWKKAKKHLPWENYQELKEGVDRRNAIAHDGEIFECEICINDIKNVQKQLMAWDIIDSAQRIENLTVTVKRTRLQ